MAEDSFINDFISKFTSLDLSDQGKALVDYVKVLDALGVKKNKIKQLIVGLFKRATTLF